jgi:hypothetical protein
MHHPSLNFNMLPSTVSTMIRLTTSYFLFNYHPKHWKFQATDTAMITNWLSKEPKTGFARVC